MNTQLPDYKKNQLPTDEVCISKSNLHKSNIHKLVNQIKVIGKWIEGLLTTKCEFKIWHGKDRTGHSYWKVYDPRTNCTVSLGSEEEVRVWIEESFSGRNQKSDRTPTSFDLYQHRLFF